MSKSVYWAELIQNQSRNNMSAMTVSTGTNNSNSSANNTTTNANLDTIDIFPTRTPVWSTLNQTSFESNWNDSLFSPSHRPWPSESFGNDIGGDELPYPRQLNPHLNHDFSPLPASSPANLLNGINHQISQSGRFQFPTDSSSSPYYSQQLPLISGFNESFYEPSPPPPTLPSITNFFSTDLDRRSLNNNTNNNNFLDSRSSLDNHKLTIDQMVNRFNDLQLQPPSSTTTYSPQITDQQQQSMPSPFCYQSSSPFTNNNQLYLNSPTQYQTNLFNERYDRTDGYLSFSNPQTYLSQMRFSPNQAYRTTKSGKQQIGPENSNLFICHLPQETTDQTLMNLFSQFGTVLSAKVRQKFNFCFVVFLYIFNCRYLSIRKQINQNVSVLFHLIILRQLNKVDYHQIESIIIDNFLFVFLLQLFQAWMDLVLVLSV